MMSFSSPRSTPTAPTRQQPHLSPSAPSTHHSQLSPVLLTPGSHQLLHETDHLSQIDHDSDDLTLTSPSHKSHNSYSPETPSQIRRAPSTCRRLNMPSTPSIASSSGTARSDSSGVLPRPSVDPGIRGQPQGWEGDLTVPLPPVPATAPERQNIVFPSSSAIRPPLNPPSDQKHSRLVSFRGETKAKLSNWRDRAFPELVEGRRRRDEAIAERGGGDIMVPQISRGSGNQSEAAQNVFYAGSSRPSKDILATPTQSSTRPQDPGLSTPILTPYCPTTTVASEDAIADLFITYSQLPPATPESGSTSQITTPLTIPSRTQASYSHHPLPELPQSSRGDAHSVISTESSTSTHGRDRVMGIHPDSSRPTISSSSGSKRFISPDVHDVLPFASSRLYSAWDLPPENPKGNSVSAIKGKHRVIKSRRQSMSEDMTGREKFGSSSTGTGSGVVIMPEDVNVPGWKDLPRSISAIGQKRFWIGADGNRIGAYRVGWEREIMDVEARLHDAMYDIAGRRHTFITLDDGKEPKTVLDIGTGLGLWPVSQALEWRNTHFVGLDAVPCQLDLGVLARCEKLARSISTESPTEEGKWEDLNRRVTWDQANFLTTLPYDTGVFDHVHLRFLSLGLSESAWPALLDEALRVLAPGGYLEIVDLSISLPPSTPASISRSFASTLQAEMINPDPSLPIQFSLPLLDGLRPGMGGPSPVFEKSGEEIFDEVGLAWMRSTLEYKGTGMDRAGSEMIGRLKNALKGGKWGWDEKVEVTQRVEDVRVDAPKVCAWVVRKKS